MSVLQQKIEFYKRESDCEAIIIAAGGLGALWSPQPADFSIMRGGGGPGDGRNPSLDQSKNLPVPPTNVSLFPIRFPSP